MTRPRNEISITNHDDFLNADQLLPDEDKGFFIVLVMMERKLLYANQFDEQLSIVYKKGRTVNFQLVTKLIKDKEGTYEVAYKYIDHAINKMG